MGFCCFKCCFGCGSPDLKKKSSPKKKSPHRIHKAERVDEPDLATDEQDLVTEVIFAPAKKRHQRSKRRLTDLSPPSPASESPVPESPPPKTACKSKFYFTSSTSRSLMSFTIKNNLNHQPNHQPNQLKIQGLKGVQRGC